MALQPGDFAVVHRAFETTDVDNYIALAGQGPPVGTVPEPLIGALFSYLLGVKLPGMGTNYLKQESEFHMMARVGETLIARVEITRLRPEKHLVDLRTTCRRAGGELICEGRALVYAMDFGQ